VRGTAPANGTSRIEFMLSRDDGISIRSGEGTAYGGGDVYCPSKYSAPFCLLLHYPLSLFHTHTESRQFFTQHLVSKQAENIKKEMLSP
jgi:hypothetical protein